MDCLTAIQPYAGPRLDAFRFPTDTAVFAVGDVHGQRHKLRELLGTIAAVRTPGQRRVLVFLGDLPDRGPDTLGTLEEASTAADTFGFDEALHLPGNHELMMLDALEHLMAGGDPAHPRVQNWLRNGGVAALLEAYPGLDHTNLHAAATAFVARLPLWNGTPWMAMLRAAPSHLRVGDAVFVHAGITPKAPLATALGFPQTQHLDAKVGDHHWAWVRRPFLEWPFGFTEEGRLTHKDATTPGVLVVHGHSYPTGVNGTWLNSADRLLRGLARVQQSARLNLDGGAAAGHMVAGAVLTHQGWHLAAADGMDA